MEVVRFRCTRVREVNLPTRNNSGDAGLDFYVPTDLTISDLVNVNTSEDTQYNNKWDKPGGYELFLSKGKVTKILLKPYSRILIPSGIKVLLEPKNSMMMAANKSGRATKQGLIFTAEICDSPYTGEYHIGIFNTSCNPQIIEAGKSIVQFIHVPIFLTDVEEISSDEYETYSIGWGTRGDKGFGSSDVKE